MLNNYSKIISALAADSMQNSPMHENDARKTIAKWLEDALDATDVSQLELSRRMEHMNLSQPKISKIIKCDRGMSAAELLAAAEALGVPLPSLSPHSQDLQAAAGDSNEAVEPEIAELSLRITKELEKSDFGGHMPADDYIEASAILYTMLKTTGAWHPDLWEASRKMMAKVKIDKELTEMPFRDYIKSIALYYKTFVDAELDNQ